MAVYVDDAGVTRRGRIWHHMTADSIAEMHAFAANLGIKRCWYHRASRHPHYDVTHHQREAALRSGAVAVSRRFLLAAAKRLLLPARTKPATVEVLL